MPINGERLFMIKYIALVLLLLFFADDSIGFDCSSLQNTWVKKERLDKEYWNRVGNYYEKDKVKDLVAPINEIEKRYQNYIRTIFIDNNDKELCLNSSDLGIKLLNIIHFLENRRSNYNNFAEFISGSKDNHKVIWFMDSLIEKDQMLQKAWYAKYSKGLVAYLSSKMFYEVINNNNVKTLYSLMYLFYESDGLYSDLLNDKIFEILKKKPILIQKELSNIAFAKESVQYSFCELLNDEKKALLRDVYSESDDLKEKTIASWFVCEDDGEIEKP